MQKIRSAVSAILIVSLFACSSSGSGGSGSPEDYDPMGEGNIPVAEPGRELSDVNFEFNSADLAEEVRTTLRENSQWMIDNPNSEVVIEGHCDERGTAEYNMALGMRRAQSVYDYLRSLGVDESQLSRISYGEELPLDPESNEAAWAKNRRAHFTIKE